MVLRKFHRALSPWSSSQRRSTDTSATKSGAQDHVIDGEEVVHHLKSVLGSSMRKVQ